MFKITLKTKAGNDVRKKVTFNVMFSCDYSNYILLNKKVLIYTYTIYFGDNRKIVGSIYKLDESKLASAADGVLKVMYNLLIIVEKLCKINRFTPDFILLNSPDIKTYLGDTRSPLYNIFDYSINNKGRTSNTQLKRFYRRVKEDVIEDQEIFTMLRDFSLKYNSTTILPINTTLPKYEKSLEICNTLKEQLKKYKNSQNE